jgi:hypothetical protein
MLLDLLPQPTVKAWKAKAKEKHGMGEDSFEKYKGQCSSQWRKERQGGNGGISIDYPYYPNARSPRETKLRQWKKRVER